jgi:hypothetical protein
MEEFALLGNVAAVPVIIGATQLLKKNFSFKYKSDVVSLAVAFVVCPAWWFWNTPDIEIIQAVDGGVLEVTRFVMRMILISLATWMSATKSYDLFGGNKKRTAKVEAEKQEIKELHASETETLSAKIQELENNLTTGEENGLVDDSEISDKLLDILEGRD